MKDVLDRKEAEMKRRILRGIISILSFSLISMTVANPIWAQQSSPDPMGDSFFSPELIMQHQQEIGLTDEQKAFLKAETRKVQPRFTELQWQLQDEAEKLLALVKGERVDEKQALAELDKLLDIEREVKRLQVTLVIRIKNDLTAEQQAKLSEIRKRSGIDKSPK